jgi:glycosyltransferase involved in cell wall biosynthesis
MDFTLRSLYICYLSVEDPLVHTQVIAYLSGLAAVGHTIHLLTFDPELGEAQRARHQERLRDQGIVWHSLRYHKRPSLPATVYDALVGAAVGTRIMRRERLEAVHARNHVPAASALLIRRLTRCRLIFDIRGLMAEEYVDAGRWKRGGIPYRLTDWMQRAAIQHADGLVMLTEAVRRHLFGDPPSRNSAHVIPCCADLERIEAQLAERLAVRREIGAENRPVMVYVGKFTGRYLEREMVEFFDVSRQVQPGLKFLVLTQSESRVIVRELDRRDIPATDYFITRAAPDEVGRYLAAADFAICFYRLEFSEIAASPTKIGEYLGAGLPIVSTAGVGDTDELIRAHEVGAVVEELSPGAYHEAAAAIVRLLEDATTAERCQRVAREHLSLRTVGIPSYDRVYREVAALS